MKRKMFARESSDFYFGITPKQPSLRQKLCNWFGYSYTKWVGVGMQSKNRFYIIKNRELRRKTVFKIQKEVAEKNQIFLGFNGYHIFSVLGKHLLPYLGNTAASDAVAAPEEEVVNEGEATSEEAEAAGCSGDEMEIEGEDVHQDLEFIEDFEVEDDEVDNDDITILEEFATTMTKAEKKEMIAMVLVII